MEKNTKKPSSLFGDFEIVQKRKIWFAIPAVIVVLALVFGTIWAFVFGSPLNLSMDFAGGYSMTVNLSTKLTDENYADYEARIQEIARELTDEEGNVYGLEIDHMQRQGLDDPIKASILIRYKAIKIQGVDESAYMQEVNERFKTELDKLFVFLPSVTLQNGGVTAVYANPLPDFNAASFTSDPIIRAQAEELGITVTAITVSEDGKTLFVECTGDVTAEKAEQFLTISDPYSGKTTEGNIVTPLVGLELLTDAILAIALALTLMLVYITFRFEGSSGFVAVLALFHDILVMLAFMVIFHVEIGGTFIAALITILGYSVTNTIILFDRVREKLRPFAGKPYNPNRIANESAREVFKRALITTITTLIPITIIALIGVQSIQIFAFPIIVGLIAGMFSTLFLAPSFWTMWKNHLIAKAPAGAVTAPIPRKAAQPKRAVSATNHEQPVMEADEPEADEPEADEPEADEPEVDEPEVDEPEVDESEVDEPEVDESEVEEASTEEDALEQAEPVSELETDTDTSDQEGNSESADETEAEEPNQENGSQDEASE